MVKLISIMRLLCLFLNLLAILVMITYSLSFPYSSLTCEDNGGVEQLSCNRLDCLANGGGRLLYNIARYGFIVRCSWSSVNFFILL